VSSLLKKIVIQKMRITDHTGVEHEFEGEGVVALRSDGRKVEVVEASLKLGSQE
jgi:hypothetical protein